MYHVIWISQKDFLLFRWRILVGASTGICCMNRVHNYNRSGGWNNFLCFRCRRTRMFGEPHRRDHSSENNSQRFVSSAKMDFFRNSREELLDQTVRLIHSPGWHEYNRVRKSWECFLVVWILLSRLIHKNCHRRLSMRSNHHCCHWDGELAIVQFALKETDHCCPRRVPICTMIIPNNLMFKTKQHNVHRNRYCIFGDVVVQNVLTHNWILYI